MKLPNTVGLAGGEKGWHVVNSGTSGGGLVWSTELGYHWKTSLTCCITECGAFDHALHVLDKIGEFMFTSRQECIADFFALLDANSVPYTVVLNSEETVKEANREAERYVSSQPAA